MIGVTRWFAGVWIACAGVAAAQGFAEVTVAAGLAGLPPYVVGFGHGACAADFDGDGDQDIVFPGSIGLPMWCFRNDGGVFTDVSASAGLGVAGVVRGCSAADVDNDGDLDLFVCNWQGPGKLFINDGSGRFTEEAAVRGITIVASNFSAAFGDYDRDGWVDLYLGNHSTPAVIPEANVLYRNLGGGVFADVSVAAGVAHTGLTFTGVFVDVNEDGWPDIYCVNDLGLAYTPNTLFLNLQDGTFLEVTPTFGLSVAMDGMGFDFTDPLNDGRLGFYTTDTPPDHLFQVFDRALGRFVDRTALHGMQGGGTGWAAQWLDYDNDGWQDLHVVQYQDPNLLFRNPGAPLASTGPWPEVAASVGLAQTLPQLVALTLDYDDDGGIDLLQRPAYTGAPPPGTQGAQLFRNTVPRGHWLKVRCEGTRSNRAGLGARVRVEAAGLVQTQWVRSATGFLGGSDLRCHFGLGTATQADRVEILWPSGHVQVFEAVLADRLLVAEEPSLTAVGTAVPGASIMLDLRIQGDGGLPYAMALAFTNAPAIVLPDGRSIPIALDALALHTLTPGNGLLPGSVGVLNGAGHAASPLHIPAIPALSGNTFFATAVTAGGGLIKTLFPDAVSILVN